VRALRVSPRQTCESSAESWSEWEAAGPVVMMASEKSSVFTKEYLSRISRAEYSFSNTAAKEPCMEQSDVGDSRRASAPQIKSCLSSSARYWTASPEMRYLDRIWRTSWLKREDGGTSAFTAFSTQPVDWLSIATTSATKRVREQSKWSISGLCSTSATREKISFTALPTGADEAWAKPDMVAVEKNSTFRITPREEGRTMRKRNGIRGRE
jgi:hypothetical protein